MRGHVFKRGKTWSVDARLQRDSKGEWIRVQKGGFKTRTEAEDFLRDKISLARRGELGEFDDMRLDDFLQMWLDEYCKHQCKLSTFVNRRNLINRKISPELGHLRLDELRPIHFTRFFNKMAAAGLAGDYIFTMHSLFRTAFKCAVKWQITSRNVYLNVDAPKKSPKSKLRTWSIAESISFLKFSETVERAYVPVPHLLPDFRHIAVVMAIFTGMRRGEILGLRWSDVDYDAMLVRVMQTVYKPTGMPVQIWSPKTDNSMRSISITDEVVTALKKHRAAQNEIRLALGKDYVDHDLVCPRSNGAPMDPRSLIEYFNDCIVKSGVPRIRFHDLRHTHATIMLQLGQHPKIVSERLGHSNIAITLDTYSHVLPNMQADAAAVLSETFRKSGF